MMTSSETEALATQLDNGEAIEVGGARIKGEGTEWCVTHPNKAFETVARYGYGGPGNAEGYATRPMTAVQIVTWADSLHDSELLAE